MVQSKNLTGVFAFFLGLFGVHRFYVHRDASGAVYVVVTAVLGLPVLLHFTGWFDSAFGTDDALLWPALAGIALLVIEMCVAWVEAFRFWAMHPTKFQLLYTAPIVPSTQMGRVKTREDEPDAADAADEGWAEA